MRTAVLVLVLALGASSALAAQAPVPLKETPLAEGREALLLRGERFGVLPDEHPATVQSREIFGRLVRAAGRRGGVALELHVLDTSRIIAEALPGGLVVISRGFLDLARGDTHAIAFILGHEVAHVVRDHHGLLDSLGMLGAGRTGAASGEQVRAYQSVELESDRLGVLFAMLAGYQPSAAVPALITLTNRVGPDRFHPDPKERAGAIRDQIADVAQHLEVFHVGLAMLTSGRYLESARVLEHFLTLFPGREVLSAVGVAYHKEALRYAPIPEFRHVLVIDPATRAPSTRALTPPAQFRQHMERALHYYTLAVEADPSYAPAWNNLAAAQLDLGDRDLALGYSGRALRDDPRLAAAYNNRAVAHLLGKDRDLKRAEDDLLRASQLDPGLREAAQNLARLYELQRAPDKAARYRPERPAARSEADAGESIAGLTLGTESSKLGLAEPGVRQIKLPLASPGGELTLLLSAGRGVAVLVRDGQVDAVGSLPGSAATTRFGIKPGDPAARVEALYGRPAGTTGVQALNVWSYPSRGLTLFLVNDRVQVAWIGRPASRSDR